MRYGHLFWIPLEPSLYYYVTWRILLTAPSKNLQEEAGLRKEMPASIRHQQRGITPCDRAKRSVVWCIHRQPPSGDLRRGVHRRAFGPGDTIEVLPKGVKSFLRCLVTIPVGFALQAREASGWAFGDGNTSFPVPIGFLTGSWPETSNRPI